MDKLIKEFEKKKNRKIKFEKLLLLNINMEVKMLF